MTITAGIQQKFVVLGIDSNQLNQPSLFNTRSSITFTVYGSSIAATGIYLFYVASNLSEYMQAASIFSATIIATVTYISFFMRMEKLFDFFESLDDLIEERQQNEASKAIYDDLNQRLAKRNKSIEFYMAKLYPAIIASTKTTICFLTYFTNGMKNDAFELLFPMWLPFDWNRPFGFVIAMAFQYLMTWLFCFLYACLISFTIGSSLALIAATKDIIVILESINECIHNKKRQSQATEKLHVFIKFHSTLKQLAIDDSDIMQPSNMVFFAWCVVQICAKMLVAQVEISHHSSLIVIIGPISELLWSFALVYLFCEIFEQAGSAFAEIDDALSTQDWYLLPFNLQRILPVILANAQQPIKFECYGNIACSRETFKNVLNGGFSYFMTFRQFY